MNTKAKTQIAAYLAGFAVIALLVYIGLDASNVSYWQEAKATSNSGTLKTLVMGIVAFTVLGYALAKMDAIEKAEEENDCNE